VSICSALSTTRCVRPVSGVEPPVSLVAGAAELVGAAEPSELANNSPRLEGFRLGAVLSGIGGQG
jgi:hypothetical protein